MPVYLSPFASPDIRRASRDPPPRLFGIDIRHPVEATAAVQPARLSRISQSSPARPDQRHPKSLFAPAFPPSRSSNTVPRDGRCRFASSCLSGIRPGLPDLPSTPSSEWHSRSVDPHPRLASPPRGLRTTSHRRPVRSAGHPHPARRRVGAVRAAQDVIEPCSLQLLDTDVGIALRLSGVRSGLREIASDPFGNPP